MALGQRSFRASSFYAKLMEMLEPFEMVPATPIPSNPTQDFIQEEINRLKGVSFDLILAIGGGSVLDTAKLLSFLPHQDQADLDACLAGNFPHLKPPRPLIAVPTTAGTGSEVTPYASLETPEKKKVTVSHPALYPSLALIDPELTHSMPAYVTASTGFDALSQAIESFWSIHATPSSTTHSLRSVELILPSLIKAVENPEEGEARLAMSRASCEAGLAIAQTRTTAVHSVSYPITAHFGIAHGHACALTLASFVRFNAPVLKEKGRPLLALFQDKDYEAMAGQIESLMEGAGLERRLSKLKINESELELILRDGFRPDRIHNNPRPVSRQELSEILRDIF